MSNKREKEAKRERHAGGGGVGCSTNNASIGKHSRPGRSSCITARKCSANYSTNKTKKPEESLGAAKKTVYSSVSKKESKKSGAKIVPADVCMARASATLTTSADASPAVRHTAASVVQKEARGGQQISQVTQTLSIGKQPNPAANKTPEKNASSQKVWKEKAQPESTEGKEFSARKQQLQLSGGTTKQSTKTSSSPSTSKLKKPAIQKQDSINKPSPKDQSLREMQVLEEQLFQGKQVQRSQVDCKASTSGSDMGPASYLAYHIEWDGFSKPNNQIGVCCCLCEEDLGLDPSEDNGVAEFEFSATPVVAILPCSHAYHYHCLNLAELEGQQEEPACVICESSTSS